MNRNIAISTWMPKRAAALNCAAWLRVAIKRDGDVRLDF